MDSQTYINLELSFMKVRPNFPKSKLLPIGLDLLAGIQRLHKYYEEALMFGADNPNTKAKFNSIEVNVMAILKSIPTLVPTENEHAVTTIQNEIEAIKSQCINFVETTEANKAEVASGIDEILIDVDGTVVDDSFEDIFNDAVNAGSFEDFLKMI